MLKLIPKIFILLSFILVTNLQAQNCEYTLVMEDSFGDGWNGGFLSVTINGVTTDYTLDDPSGDYQEVVFAVNEGEVISFNYTAGSFNSEVSYIFLDAEDSVIFTDGPFPTEGDVFETTVICPTCFKIDIATIVQSVSNDSIHLMWNAGMSSIGYVVEYGPVGFPQGSGQTLNVSDTSILITGLELGYTYDFYIANDCGNEDVSSAVGPLTSFLSLSTDTTNCDYTLNLHDSFGDGWNGAVLTFVVDGVPTEYTMNTGNEASFDINFLSNQTVSLNYSGGNFENEVTYDLLDSNGDTLFQDGNFPTQGIDLFCFLACSTCLTPTLDVADISYDGFDLSWDNSNIQDVTIEYGTEWFLPGTGQTLTSTSGSQAISGLAENTTYQFYYTGNCDMGSGCKRGPISVTTGIRKDVGIGSIMTDYTVCDLFNNGALTVGITGYGIEPQSLIPVFYRIDGVDASIPMPQDGFYTGVVGFDSTELFTFETMFSFSTIGTHTLTAWTALDGDSNTANDTLEIEFEIVGRYLPMAVDFESGMTMATLQADGWVFQGGNIDNGHNNTSFVYARNLFFNGAISTIESPAYGIVNTGDNFTFDYRYTDWSPGTDAAVLGSDSLNVYISNDCGDNWDLVYSITAENHIESATMANVSVDLAAYVGDFIQIRLEGIYGGPGDYWLDIDNLNILSCGPNLGLSADITSATDTLGGSIEVLPEYGIAPFIVDWGDGNTDNPRIDLQVGTYEVTVTDALGCSDIATFVLNHITAVTELGEIINVTLSPNPVAHILNVDLSFEKSRAYTILIYNQLGQLIKTVNRDKVQTDNVNIDMSSYGDGVYYILLKGESLVHSEKVIVTK